MSFSLHEKIFHSYNISEDDVELELMTKIKNAEFDTEESIERIARLTSINKKMIRNGLEPLLIYPEYADTSKTEKSDKQIKTKTPKQCDLETSIRKTLLDKIKEWQGNLKEDEIRIAKENGLSSEEYSCIKGDYATFCDLDIDRGVADKIKRYLSRGKPLDPYIKRKVFLQAQYRLRYPETIPALRNIYLDKILLLKALKKAKSKWKNDSRKIIPAACITTS